MSCRLKILCLVTIFLAVCSSGFGQNGEKGRAGQPEAINSVKSSPAFAEVMLRKADLRSDLESLLPDYTEQNPKIIDIRFELSELDNALDRLFSVKPNELSKLTLALGKMLVRKAGLATELAHAKRSYNDEHIEVKRLKRRLEAYDTAIKEILG
jgi:uncharacterized protein involved in exopolysaccharide biosynthesis